MKHQILIASYSKDFPWLRHCLRSLDKFATRFLPTIVAVPSSDYDSAWNLVAAADARDVIVTRWDGPGFARAQSAMMSGDVLCPQADYYWLLGSDCLATRDFSPEDFCGDSGRPIMLWHSWGHLEKHCKPALSWRRGVEAALGSSGGEYMRRLPLAYRTSMLPELRNFIAAKHGTPFSEYIVKAVNVDKNFSESNIMGEWARLHCPENYEWVCLDNGAPTWLQNWGPTSPIRQFWSHGGFDRPHDADKVCPREYITKILGSF